MLARVSGHRQFWQELEAIFDPDVAVERPELFAERDPRYNPLARFQRELRRPSKVHRKYLITGTVGNGKTSELYHLASELATDRMIVLVDLWRHFDASIGDVFALDRLQPWELLGLLGLAIYRAGEQRFGHKWDDEPKQLQDALEQLRRADQGEGAKIDVVALSQGLAVAAGGLLGSVAGPVGTAVGAALGGTAGSAGLAVLEAVADATSWTWSVGRPNSRRHLDSEPEVRRLVNAVNRLIMTLQSCYDCRLLLIVDGLDRVRDGERARVLFAESSLVRELVCDVMITAPIGLIGTYAHDSRSPDTHILCNLPVLDREHPGEHGPGIAFFRELVDKRVAEVNRVLPTPGPPAPFPDPIVARLAYYSGGLPRDFIRLVRMVAGEAWEADTAVVTDDIVELALREARRLKEADIDADDIKLLRAVMDDPDHQRPSGAVATKLLSQQRLLPYPNETVWYYPHPLLTLALLKPSGSPS